MHTDIEEQLIRIIQRSCSEMRPEPTGATETRSTLEGIKAVLFDVYGTLFVSGSGDIGVASQRSSGGPIREAMAAAGIPLEKGALACDRANELLIQEIRRTHADLHDQGIESPEVDIRETWRAVLDVLLDEGIVQTDLSDELIMRLAVEYECRANPVWPMPDLLSVLGKLRERGIRLGIVSNAQFYTPLLFPALLDETLDELGFAASLCVWSYTSREAKPSVQLFHKALAALKRDDNIAPSEVAYVGNDMLNDMTPSSAVGCRTVLFAGDKRSLRLREGDPRCVGIAPDAVVTDLSQLIDILE